MSSSRRDKLTDLLRNVDRPFAPRANTFAEAYPTIAHLSVEVSESVLGRPTGRQLHFTEKNFRGAIDCRNPQCYGGGVEIGMLVHRMITNGQREQKFLEHCEGYEGSPKGQRRYRDCLTYFDITIQIVLKRDLETESAS